ncbi:MAG: S1 RNA-binding domain-containing protein [Thermoanaerobaculia bacterium]
MSDRTPPENGQDFASLLDAFEKKQAEGEGNPPKAPQIGDRISAKIVGFGEETAFVDLGRKSEGKIPLSQLTDDEGQRTVAVGDTVEAIVAAISDDGVLLRVRAGRGPAAPAELQQAHTYGLPVDGTVSAVVKGGVEVTVSGVRAFCPISQLDLRYVEDAASYIGQRLSFRITRYEEGKGRNLNLVLSRRALLAEEAEAKAAIAREKLVVGKTVRGTVTSLATYGAFVDLGGVEGLLHVSELGHGRVDHPKDVLAVGQEVEVQILKISPPDEKGREKISLSRRALVADPWQEEAAKLVAGSRRQGKVTRLELFGAFVELAPGLEGLLHISELAASTGREVRHPREMLKIGQSIEVAIASVDRPARRISLALPAKGDDAAPEDLARAGSGGSGFGAFGDFFAQAAKKSGR